MQEIFLFKKITFYYCRSRKYVLHKFMAFRQTKVKYEKILYSHYPQIVSAAILVYIYICVYLHANHLEAQQTYDSNHFLINFSFIIALD